MAEDLDIHGHDVLGTYGELVKNSDIVAIMREFESGGYVLFTTNRNGEVVQTMAEGFVRMIAIRLHTEWCLSAHHQNHAGYRGQGMSDWIDREALFEYKRLVPQSGESHEVYLEARERVLRAITARAVTLFSEWNGGQSPPGRLGDSRNTIYDDRRNLRDRNGLLEFMPSEETAA